ncbi:Rop guanine nucleotide exchange factor [Arachis hypogaea]|nr:Rop guanine nucleotide exchange factor [Arachis hypogaea]
MAINNNVLAEIDIPETYIDNLPKNGRANMGDTIYHYMSAAEKFSADQLLDYLKISSEHEALDWPTGSSLRCTRGAGKLA